MGERGRVAAAGICGGFGVGIAIYRFVVFGFASSGGTLLLFLMILGFAGFAVIARATPGAPPPMRNLWVVPAVLAGGLLGAAVAFVVAAPLSRVALHPR